MQAFFGTLGRMTSRERQSIPPILRECGLGGGAGRRHPPSYADALLIEDFTAPIKAMQVGRRIACAGSVVMGLNHAPRYGDVDRSQFPFAFA